MNKPTGISSILFTQTLPFIAQSFSFSSDRPVYPQKNPEYIYK